MPAWSPLQQLSATPSSEHTLEGLKYNYYDCLRTFSAAIGVGLPGQQYHYKVRYQGLWPKSYPIVQDPGRPDGKVASATKNHIREEHLQTGQR